MILVEMWIRFGVSSVYREMEVEGVSVNYVGESRIMGTFLN